MYEGQPRRKLSEGKATWPGIKQVFRFYDADKRFREDRLVLEEEHVSGNPLMIPCMRSGRRVRPPTPLEQSREHATEQLAGLPEGLRSLHSTTSYPVHYSDRLVALANELKSSG